MGLTNNTLNLSQSVICLTYKGPFNYQFIAFSSYLVQFCTSFLFTILYIAKSWKPFNQIEDMYDSIEPNYDV